MNISRHFLCLACRQPADVSSRSSSVIWGKKKKKVPKTMKGMRAASQFICLYHTHTNVLFCWWERLYPLITLKIRDPTPAPNQPPTDFLLVENHSKDSGKDISPIQSSPSSKTTVSQCYIALIAYKLGSNQSHCGVRMQSAVLRILSSLTVAFISSILIWLTHPADPRVSDTSGLHRGDESKRKTAIEIEEAVCSQEAAVQCEQHWRCEGWEKKDTLPMRGPTIT